MNRYTFPTLELLNNNQTLHDEHVEGNSTEKKLQAILNNFKIKATVDGFTAGARTTRYEVKLSTGVSISKVKRSLDDIALWLGVESVRLIPIPEKNAVGLEVPNENIKTICLRSILDTQLFKKAESKLAIGIGKTISGETVIGDIAEMPHLLVAGATGSGKSVFVNTLITSILYKATPDEVKLLMIDPKMVELSCYNGVPHLLAPVITAKEGEYKKVSQALKWVVDEMTNRYDMMAILGVRKLDEYNQFLNKVKTMGLEEYNPETMHSLPRIVVIIDELADLMLSSFKERIEKLINRIAAMGRAAGIHLVVATQRPDANIVTGLIKANIPARIAFKTSTAINSRIILDEKGAELLLGKGDMLFHKSDGNKPMRLQGAFVSNEEIERIINHIQVDCSMYNSDLVSLMDGETETSSTTSIEDLKQEFIRNYGIELLDNSINWMLNGGSCDYNCRVTDKEKPYFNYSLKIFNSELWGFRKRSPGDSYGNYQPLMKKSLTENGENIKYQYV